MQWLSELLFIHRRIRLYSLKHVFSIILRPSFNFLAKRPHGNILVMSFLFWVLDLQNRATNIKTLVSKWKGFKIIPPFVQISYFCDASMRLTDYPVLIIFGKNTCPESGGFINQNRKMNPFIQFINFNPLMPRRCICTPI